MAVIENPCWYLDPASLASREGVGVILHDPGPIPPVMPVEVRVQDIPRTGGYQASGEGARSLFFRPRKSHVVYLGVT